MEKKPRSARADERAALQKLYAPATYASLRNLLKTGKLDLRELRKYYTDARSIAAKRVARIEKSDVPFKGRPPEFLKTSELPDTDLLRAVSDVNKFLRAPTSVTERRKTSKEKKSEPKKPRSKRAEERAALQELYAPATYSGLRDLLQIGKLDLRELRKYYTDARSKALKRVERIEKSDIPFADQPPEFLKTSELSDDELLKAVSYINKFLRAPTRVTERREAYNELIDDLHSKGLTFLEMKDLKDWDRFRSWIKAKGLLNVPYTDGSIIAEIFKAGKEQGTQNSEFWQKQYEDFKGLLSSRSRSGDRASRGAPSVSLNRSRRRK